MSKRLSFAVVLLALWAVPCQAAIALVGACTSKGSAGAGNAVQSDAIDITGANLVTVAVAHAIGAIGAITDTLGTTYGAAKLTTGATTEEVTWFAAAVTGGAAFQVTLGAQANSYQTIFVCGWSGVANATVDQSTGTTSGSGLTTLSSGAVTPSENNELVLSGAAFSGVITSVTVNGGFSSPPLTDGANVTNTVGGISYLIQTSAASANPAWSWTGSQRPSVNILTFKAAAAAGGTSRNGPLLGVGP